MKEIKIYIFCTLGLLLSFSACEIHDPVDDLATIGEQAANSYWEIPNTNVLAGDDVYFEAQYWSVNDNYEYLGVWYDIQNSFSYKAIAPTVGFELSFDTLTLAREFQEIINLSSRHSKSLWSKEARAYVLKTTFPTSHTLSGSSIKQPAERSDAETAFANFPEEFQQEFRDSIYSKLLVVDDSVKVLKMFADEFLRTDTATIRSFYTEYYDENAGDYLGAITEQGKEEILNMLNSIPFDSLTFDFSRLYFNIEYLKNYSLNAKFRVVNGNGVENYSEQKEITVN